MLKLLVRLKHLQTEDIKPEDTMEIESLSITEEVLPSTHILDTLYLDVLPIFITHSVDHLDRTLCVNGLPLGTTEKSIAVSPSFHSFLCHPFVHTIWEQELGRY